MQALFLTLSLCALQLCPAVLGGPQHQRFVLGNGWPVRLSRVGSFAWQNCASSYPARIKSMNISPDPICIPGDMTISASGLTTMAIVAPVKGVVILEKKIGDMWLKVPCMDGLGSCTYADICAELDAMTPPGQPCPEPLLSYGIPCHCPFKAIKVNEKSTACRLGRCFETLFQDTSGFYSLPPSDIYIPNMDLPSFLTNGDYRLKATLSKGDQPVACVKVSFSLHSESRWFWW